MRRRASVFAAAVLLTLAACGGDDEEPTTAAATPSPSPSPIVTTPPPSTPPPSTPPPSEPPADGPTMGKQTPEEAAQAFYADWGELDRRSASGYATQAAIDEAFGQQRAQAEFIDCTEEGDHFSCFYYYEGGGLGITVVDSDAYGHIVTDIHYVAD